jgi:hypothetical protein
MSAYVAAIAYYVVNWPPASLHDMLTQNTKLFLTWSILTVLIYLPPITLAAAASMYLFDQEQASVTPLTFTDYASGAVLTFIASVMLCFFVLLGYGVLLPSLTGTSVSEISKLAPWTIPAASVATTFLLLSVYPRHDTAKVSEPILYVGSLSGVALLGGLIAEFLSGPPEPGKLGTLPDDSIYYLVVIMPFCIGACIGWLLSGTRHPRQSGTDVRPAAPSLHQCESLSTTVSRAA